MNYSLVVISAIPGDANPIRSIDHVKSHVVNRDPYELKIVFDDDSRMTVNLNHVFTYAVYKETPSERRD